MTNQPNNVRRPRWLNRGNTLVLVTAILVLLVIIATAFISRTQTGRKLAVAQQHAFERDSSASVHGGSIAGELSRALFARDIDPDNQAFAWQGDWINFNGDFAELTLSGVPRKSDSTPWVMNLDFDNGAQENTFVNNDIAVERFSTDNDSLFDFNFAPLETRAWTNWPDDTGDALLVPYGPGALNTVNGFRLRDVDSIPLGTGNPRGNPGFGDTRWLRDTEPRRGGNYYEGSGYDPSSEFYTHWTHLSWLPTAENGWRVCPDISNVAQYDEQQAGAYTPSKDAGYTLSTMAFEWDFGNQMPYHDAYFPVAIQTPYEQWYPNVIPAELSNIDDFFNRRNDWFSRPTVHFEVMRDPNYVLPNYFDLDSWGPDNEKFEPGTWRNAIERTFADTDGDGFTDSFWFVPPASSTPGVRQVVGISIIDNNSMLDANVATSFDRWSTSGATPADLALVSRLDGDVDTWVGFFNDPKNHVAQTDFYPTEGDVSIVQKFGSDSTKWFATNDPDDDTSFLNVRGLSPLVESVNGYGPFYGQYRAVGGDLPEDGVRERKLWNRLAQNNFKGSWISTDGELVPYSTTGFDMTDEIELRAHSGLNHSAIYSRFERALNEHVTASSGAVDSFLRSHIDRPEVAPIRKGYNYDGDQNKPVASIGSNTNLQQVRDNRHRLTFHTGARNEFRPLWLWQTPKFNLNYDYDRNNSRGTYDDFLRYKELRQKIDLRQTYELPAENPAAPGSWDWVRNRKRWLLDLQDAITRATTVYGYDAISDRTVPQSYFSNPEWSLDDAVSQEKFQEAYYKSLKMAASYAANIEAFRDGPEPFQTETGEIIYLDQPLHPYLGLRVPQRDPNNLDLEIVDTGDGNPRDDVFIGLEKQPFIMQAYFGLVYPKSRRNVDHPDNVDENGNPAWEAGYTVPTGLGFPDGGENFVDSTSKPAIVVAIQLGNPFDEPLSLYDYHLQIGEMADGGPKLLLKQMRSPHPRAATSGQSVDNAGGFGYNHQDLYLGPTEPDAPRSAIVFAVLPPFSMINNPDFESEFQNGTDGTPGFGMSYEEFKRAWLDTLDLLPGELFGYEEDMDLEYHQTLVLDASTYLSNMVSGSTENRIQKIFGEGSSSGGIYAPTQTTGNNNAGADDPYVVRVIRQIEAPAYLDIQEANVVVDRLNHERESSDDPRNTTIADEMGRYGTAAAADDSLGERGLLPPAEFINYDHNGAEPSAWAGIRLVEDDFFLSWVRVSRVWGWDVDANGLYDMDELSPRYAFSVESGVKSVETTQNGYVKGGSQQPRTFTGDRFSIADTAVGVPDQNLWMTARPYTLPLTQLGTPLPNGWDWQGNRPPAYEARGKPTNFPTWTVVPPTSPGAGQGAMVKYGTGFPLEIVAFNNDGSYEVQERATSPFGTSNSFTNMNLIPMDLRASSQEDFYEDFREDLWSAPLQMLLKDDDFEQIGELTHVFLWGPVINQPIGAPTAAVMNTRRTFAELMTEIIEYDHGGSRSTRTGNSPSWWGFTGTSADVVDDYPVGTGVLANRLDIQQGREPLAVTGGPAGTDPGRPWRQVLGAAIEIPAYRPYLPAGSGLFDAVTVDGRGMRSSDMDLDGDGAVSLNESMKAEQDRLDLARGFTGEPTRGLINVNTAPVEVMRALPQMSRLVYNDYFEFPHTNDGRWQAQRSAFFDPSSGFEPVGGDNNMHVRLPEAIERYRSGDALLRVVDDGVPAPSTADRGFTGIENDIHDDYPSILTANQNDHYGFFPGMRNDRGIVSLGELLTMQRTQFEEAAILGDSPGFENLHDWRYKSSSIRSLGNNPYALMTLDLDYPYSKGYGYPNPTFGQGMTEDYARERYFMGWRDERSNEGLTSGNSVDWMNASYADTPARVLSQLDARVSTDRNSTRRNPAAYRNFSNAQQEIFAPDMVGGDAEEANMLFSGVANMLTTRSDVFTIYMTIRTFKQDPVTGVWDATRKENVVDESRYMMVVDRSSVQWPTEQPRILSFSKIE